MKKKTINIKLPSMNCGGKNDGCIITVLPYCIKKAA